MDAHQVDDAARRLAELRHEAWQEAIVGGLTLVAAVAATGAFRPLAVPLLVGGFALTCLALGSFWRRWDALDRLATRPEAYEIPAVRAHAGRLTTMEQRRSCAAAIRALLDDAAALDDRSAAVRAELEALSRELDDERLRLDPRSAVACARLVAPGAPQLADLVHAPVGLEWRIRAIRAGFAPTEEARS